MLVDDRGKVGSKEQKQESAKHRNQELEVDPSSKELEPEAKKPKVDEESVFEKEFNCGIYLLPACPCCDPNNTLGYVCPDGVRLAPLPQGASYSDHLNRRQFQPGHTQCKDRHTHPPIIPATVQDGVTDQFRYRFSFR